MVNMNTFKRMCRLLDLYRRFYFEKEWRFLSRNTPAEKLSSRQMNHLMMIRFRMPCNLNQVMLLTGLSSSAASIFVDNLVKSGVVERDTDPLDRRNILIVPTLETKRLFEAVDSGLDRFIDERTRDCSQKELDAIENAGVIICGKLEKEMGKWAKTPEK